MTTHNTRYFTEYRDNKEQLTRIEIKELDYNGPEIEVFTAENNLKIQFPALKTFCTPLIGGGCEFELLAPADGEFLNLYTTDPLKFKVLVYKKGVCFWDGYLNTETHIESYNAKTDYPVILTANNGLRVLERIPFVDTNKANFTGLATQWDIITNILSRVNLSIPRVNVCFDRWEERHTPTSNATPLHLTSADQANYYDEKGEPLNCFEVLESVLQPLGVCCFKDLGNLYFVHFTEFRKGERVFKSFNSSFAYVETFTDSNGILDISAGELAFSLSDQSISLKPGYNTQIVKYSPYPYDELTNPAAFDNQEFWENPALTWFPVEEDGETHYKAEATGGLKGWFIGGNVKIKGYKKALANDGEFCISTKQSEDWPNITFFSNELNNVTISRNDKMKMKLGFSFRILTKETPYSKNQKVDFNPTFFHSYARIEIGNQVLCRYLDGSYSNVTYHWMDTNTPGFPEFTRLTKDDLNTYLPWVDYSQGKNEINGGTPLGCSWNDVEIPISEGWPKGKIKISFYSWVTDAVQMYYSGSLHSRYETVEYQFKDIEIKTYRIVSETLGDGSTVDYEIPTNTEDLEFKATLSGEFAKESEKLELIHADSYENFSFDRGGFLLSGGEYTKQWKRPGETEYLPLVDHLLKDIATHYGESRIVLTGTVESDNLLSQTNAGNPKILSINSVISDTNQILGPAKFRFTGGTYDDYSQTLAGEWEEIKDESILIQQV